MTTVKDTFNTKGQVKWIKSVDGVVLEESEWFDNQIISGTNLGIQLFHNHMIGNDSTNLRISYADIGTGQTAPTASDTGLEEGKHRAQTATATQSGQVSEYRFFFSDAVVANDTYYEFGMFMAGTSTVGTGKIFNRLLFPTPITKAAGEDYTVICKITSSV